VAKKTVRVSDLSGKEIPEGKGAMIKIIFRGARKGVRELDAPETKRRRSWADGRRSGEVDAPSRRERKSVEPRRPLARICNRSVVGLR
jgi:hypothetical protein